MRKLSSLCHLDKQSIGDRMRYLIRLQGMTPCSFATSVGMTRPALYQILSGRSIPTIQTLVDISAALGCSVDFLLGIHSPEDDPAEGFESALLNTYAFRSEWTRAQKKCLSCAILGRLTKEQEEKLRKRYSIPDYD